MPSKQFDLPRIKRIIHEIQTPHGPADRAEPKDAAHVKTNTIAVANLTDIPDNITPYLKQYCYWKKLVKSPTGFLR